MLIGEFQYNIDQKGRLMIPAKFRHRFGIDAIITKGLETCLFIFPKDEWEKVVEKILKLPISQSNSRAFTRLMLAGAFESSIDNQGRILIPEFLRKYANLEKKVVIVGLYSRLEVWNEDEWRKYSKESESQAQEIAEKLGDLGI
ncbi:MAG: transcriptional regulator MraZ [Candidatus Parcubacteria bacterium]|nr:MAG: transcriptional regulator MraZ [Candidatus Parcubacteria bacterium]